MNQKLIIFFATLTLISCNYKENTKKKLELKKYDENGKLIVYNVEEYSKMWLKNKKLNVTVIDTFCKNQKKRAQQDIKNGKLIYFRPNYLEFHKMSALFKKYDIETKEFNFSCIRMGGFQPYCYQDEMHKEIQRKFGNNFIDSLTEIAKKEYVIENPNVEYMQDGKDLREKYLNKKNSY